MFVPRRLDKYLRDYTTLSVVDIRRACTTGRVRIGSSAWQLAPTADILVFEEDVVFLDGVRVEPQKCHHYVVWNKPRHVTTTVHDPNGHTDLGPWLAQMPAGVFPVGRLDRETSGALLFTDDGDFANAILQPDHHTEKLYWLWLDESVSESDPRLAAFLAGVRGTSTPMQATAVQVVRRTDDFTEVHVTLDEGKNRQIRKMCNLARLRLLQLHRKAIGTLTIDDLPLGSWRALSALEVDALWTSAGGQLRVFENKLTALQRHAALLRAAGTTNPRLDAWLTVVARATRTNVEPVRHCT